MASFSWAVSFLRWAASSSRRWVSSVTRGEQIAAGISPVSKARK
ncbi:MAG: hypothetical protein M0029_00700 [Actinomycetota bacterium]|nr:hypothetical protein [Actinomycetota bacterium]